MATTKIGKIYNDVSAAMCYVIRDKTELYKGDAHIVQGVPCDVFDDTDGLRKVRYRTLCTYQKCNMKNPTETFNETIENGMKRTGNLKGKTKSGKDIVAYHLKQCFAAGEVDYATAHEIGVKLAADIFKDFPVVITTHTNTGKIHNHFMICAWDENGRKWHSCNATYRQIRSTSDQLCREYNLSVLNETAEMRLLKFTDKTGNLHYFEPTDRKIELIRARKEKIISHDDVGGYRNTAQWEDNEAEKVSAREIVKRDIDRMLPYCQSYDELLRRLREMGYVINDRKKDGSWLSHVSFRAPFRDKATRDDKIGDGTYYRRENLQKYIDNQVAEKQYTPLLSISKYDAIPYFERYEYGQTNIASINTQYRKKKLSNNKYEVVQRAEPERKVIDDVKKIDAELGIETIETDTIKNLIDAKGKVPQYRKSRKWKCTNSPKTQRLLTYIRNDFRALAFLEQNNIYSTTQLLPIRDTYKAKIAEYNAILLEAEKKLAMARNAKQLPQLIERLKEGESNYEYMLESAYDDRAKAELLAKFVNKIGGAEKLNEKIEKISEHISAAKNARDVLTAYVSELECCGMVMKRIERDIGNRGQKKAKEKKKEMQR